MCDVLPVDVVTTAGRAGKVKKKQAAALRLQIDCVRELRAFCMHDAQRLLHAQPDTGEEGEEEGEAKEGEEEEGEEVEEEGGEEEDSSEEEQKRKWARNSGGASSSRRARVVVVDSSDEGD